MTIRRQHNKSTEELKQIIDKIAVNLSNDLGLDYKWKGERLEFYRTGVNGSINVEPEELVVKVNKSFFIPISDSTIRTKVEEYFDAYLG